MSRSSRTCTSARWATPPPGSRAPCIRSTRPRCPRMSTICMSPYGVGSIVTGRKRRRIPRTAGTGWMSYWDRSVLREADRVSRCLVAADFGPYAVEV
ncbi:hypothetical protein DIPPA_22859 [Diplonema papillatum]|nr:hypothetical protein DIPPA_22859 [Diplonema papillatum]